MAFWRPFEVNNNRPTAEIEGASPQRKPQKIKVGEHESNLVMKVHLNVSDKGWQAVLNQVRIKIQTAVPLNSPIVRYYLDGEDSVLIRRMKRIVSEASKKKAEVYKSSLNLQQSSKEPEGRLELPASESVQYDVAETFTGKQLRYAKRKTPEERKKDKLAAFNDSSGSDNDDASTQQPVRKRKMSAKESALEAQTAHTKMCEQASTTL